MSIVRYSASADTTITNAYQSNLITRATGSNMGAADSLEVFSIFAQASTSSLEASRIMVQFPISSLQTDISSKIVPSSGANYVLNLYNVRHAETLPSNFTLVVQPISGSWVEGTGLDMEEYTDLDYANWISGSNTSAWINQGGDYYTQYAKTVYFDKGTEDLSLDITDIVQLWLSGTIPNNGLGIMLTSSQESANRSYYTKKFSARSSEYWFKRPNLEVRFNDSKFDDRSNFIASSSLASGADNLNTLFLYNYVRGKLTDIPAIQQGNIYVDLYDSSSASKVNTAAFTGGWCSTGIYSCSVYAATTASSLYDVWYSGSTQYHTGSTITVKILNSNEQVNNEERLVTVMNIKDAYSPDEIATFRVYVRNYDWSPNIYTVATKSVEKEYLKNLYYRICRVVDGIEVIAHNATSSTQHTNLSYDSQGNYFKLNMKLLEPGYMYTINFYEKNDDNNIVMLDGNFKFRVE